MKTFIHVFVLLFFILIYGCYTTKEIVSYKDLSELIIERNDEIQIVMKDTTVYSAKLNSFTDSTISFHWVKESSGETANIDSLFFRDISYIQFSESSFLLGVAYVGATGFILGYGLPVALADEGMEPYVRYGGGCQNRRY